MEYINKTNVAIITLSGWITISFIRAHRRARTTALKGPPNKSFFLGLSADIFSAPDEGALFEEWANLYGPVYQVPSIMGSKQLVLCDPAAIIHHYSNDTFTYQQPPASRLFLGYFFGHGIIWAEEETHKRQRKALAAAFSNAAIRDLTPVFYDSVYTLKNSWDAMFEDSASRSSVVIDVQKWMNCISLDSIGKAGFSHDFGSLKGHQSGVAIAFDSFGGVKPNLMITLAFILAPVFPALIKVPTKRTALFAKVKAVIKGIADDLLEAARAEKEASQVEGPVDKSIVGTLIRSESASSAVRMSYEEIMSQMNIFILAGYETTAISLTWALIELARNPEEQEKVREELAQFSADDPTWEQLTNSLPYLDAVVCETLRLHPAAPETLREATTEDVIPLSAPMEDARGQLINSIFVAKGTVVRIPIRSINRSEYFWGENAKEFIPARWLDGTNSQQKATEIQGFRHLLTFIDGPRTCLGKGFALTEFKAVLSVLVRNYTFELPDGLGTKIGSHRSILSRPMILGEDGPKVPVIVGRVE